MESVTRVVAPRAPGVYVRVDCGGKRYRLVFYPGDYEESSPPPVIEFLKEVCRRNEEMYESARNSPGGPISRAATTMDRSSGFEGGKSVDESMPIERGIQDFKYQSTLGDIAFLWFVGIMTAFLAAEGLRGSGVLGHARGFVFVNLAYSLLLSGLGSFILYGASDVQILDGQFRFRRLFSSKSVPLTSITRVRRLWLPPAVFVRVDYGGNRYRLIFSPWERRPGFSAPPVVRFLQDVCKSNAERVAQTQP